MKGLLHTIRSSFDHCQQQRAAQGDQMLKLDDLLSPEYVREEKEKSAEYKSLYGQLQQRNADLKAVIDEVRQIFVLINQLNVP